jgi:hypothetical protein
MPPMKQDANNQRRKHLELFARLANIEDLGGLKDWEKLRLVDEIREAGFIWLPIPPLGRSGFWNVPHEKIVFDISPHDLLSKSWGLRDQVPFEWQVLLDSHDCCRPTLNDLLDGKEVLLDFVNTFDRTILWLDAQTSRLQYRLTGNNPAHSLRIVFEDILRQKVFPFRRCPVCRTVFVPGKNQKYCAPACMIKGTQASRKDERREYMKAYMAKKRAKKKQPVVTIRGTSMRKGETP